MEKFTEAWAYDIINRASRILGQSLPGCSIRRYECLPEDNVEEWIFLCFRIEGPVLPFLDIQPLKYFNGVQSWFCYKPMFLISDTSVGTEPITQAKECFKCGACGRYICDECGDDTEPCACDARRWMRTSYR